MHATSLHDFRRFLKGELLISSSVEYLHFGYDKAEGRGQKAEGKKEGCKGKENYK
ncbi:MAG: hypothetical protein F6J86_01350 [Symploca sp. SIO1B1]|nr:hypothetical protein [Symploca sp. SIO2D2]NER92508.1 hypothetical protein [Symploca sp. SIO1B1]